MNGLWPLCKKELLEQWRSYRVLVVLVLFALIGMASPVLAKLTPLLLEKFANTDATSGIELIITKQPSVDDAILQYQKNLGMLPLLVVLLAMGAVSNEKRRRTLPMVVTRPVSRRALLRAKLIASGLLLLVAQVLSAALCLGYTQFLFGTVDFVRFAALNGLFLLLLLCFLTVTLLASTLLESPVAAAGLGVAFFALVSLTGMLEKLAVYTPAGLQNAIMDLCLGREPQALLAPILVTLGLSVGSMLVAEQAWLRQEL